MKSVNNYEFGFMSLGDVPRDALAAALSYHVITGANVRSEDITDGMVVTTFQGCTFEINTTASLTITN